MTIEWIHCNVCGALPSSSANLAFYISKCGHLHCGKCLLRGISRNSKEASGGCGVCKQKVTFVPLNNKLSADAKQFFMPLHTLLAQQCQKLQDVAKFQAKQRARLNAIMQHKQRKLAERASQIQKSLHSSAEKMNRLRTDNAKLQHDLNESRGREEQLRQELNEARKELQGAKKILSSAKRSRPSLCGPTPISTISFANVISSTPIISGNQQQDFFMPTTRCRSAELEIIEEQDENSFRMKVTESPIAGFPFPRDEAQRRGPRDKSNMCSLFGADVDFLR